MWWKKAIPVVVAMILIVIIGSCSYTKYVKEQYADAQGNVTKEDYLRFLPKYKYSDAMKNMNEYFTIYSDEYAPLIIAGKCTQEYARLKDEHYYLDMDLIEKYVSKRFYYNEVEHRLLYTTIDSIYKTATDGKALISTKSEEEEAADKFAEGKTVPAPGSAPEDVIQGYLLGNVFYQTDYQLAFEEEGKVYVALDYLKKFGDFSYQAYTEPNRIVFRIADESYKKVLVNEDAVLRYSSSIKGDILARLTKGDVVFSYALDEGEVPAEGWSKVMTADSLVGYIQTKSVTEQSTVQNYTYDRREVADGYSPILRDDKISMVFHQWWAAQGGNALKEVMANVEGVNVICPTWFRFKDNEGNLSNIANKNYVTKAHDYGLQVWVMLTDLDTDPIDLYAILSHEQKRTKIIDEMIKTTVDYGADGINVDVETIKSNTGEHFVQFLRELSIKTHEAGLVLSVDNYYPNESNKCYDLEEQGIVCDYVVMMGYDEHWGNCGSAGSVASINFVKDGLTSTIEKVPASQVINGVPFYTRLWITTAGVTTDELLTMVNMEDWLSRRKLTPEWNAETCQNYVDFMDGNSHYQCWLEDAESIRMKMQVMDNKQVAGVAAWKIGQEDSSVWSVFKDYLNGVE